MAQNYTSLHAELLAPEDDCVSAWNKDPVGGVIGVQTGPL